MTSRWAKWVGGSQALARTGFVEVQQKVLNAEGKDVLRDVAFELNDLNDGKTEVGRVDLGAFQSGLIWTLHLEDFPNLPKIFAFLAYDNMAIWSKRNMDIFQLFREGVVFFFWYSVKLCFFFFGGIYRVYDL